MFMKIFIQISRIITVFLFSLTISASANSIKLNNNENDIRIIQKTGDGFRMEVTLSEFKTMDVKTDKGIFTRIQVPAWSRSRAYGQPEMPVKSELIEIPAGAVVKINLVSWEVNEYRLRDLDISYALMPSQPPVAKSGKIPAFMYERDVYKIHAFIQSEIVSVEELGTMRGVRIGRLDISPFEYNPGEGIVRIYEKLEFDVIFENADPAASERNKLTYGNQYFAPVFGSLINYTSPKVSERENLTQYPVKYVIVSDPMFEDQLQPFIEWKTKKGFQVIEAYTSDPNVGGTTSQIKAFLQNLYESATPEDPAPSFVLFVGDVAQIPVFYGQAASHETDLYYCEYTGDYFPEMFYGRFSAQNAAQLQPQIDKTLMVEQYTMPVTSYQDTVVMIAGMDGTFGPTHGNGQINYGTINYFNAAHGLSSHTYLYPESGGNADNIRQNISDGVSFANYTAHGSPDGWADPSFTVGDIPSLQNNGKFGLLIGNCCSTSEYEVSNSFAEAIVRAADKGAVGYIGASNSTYWDEDYYFGVGVGTISGDPPSYEETTLGDYDRMFHTHGEPFSEWYTTMDQVIYAGNLAVTLGSPGMAEYYWEAYCLMGDPSLTVYLGEPPVLTASFDPLLPLGNMSFIVNTVPYAYVGLSMNGELLGASLADSNGVATVILTTLPQPGNADVVVTAQNYQPFTGTVLIANPEGPYVSLNQHVPNDENDNGMIEFGEEITLDIELKNWGNDDATGTMASLSTNDQYVTISDETENYGTIPAQDSVMQMAAFSFEVAGYVPDMHVVPFDVTIQDQTREVWTSSFMLTLFAPVMEIGAMLIDDTEGGNGNYRLDQGETIIIIVDCHNTGHCDAMNSHASLYSNSPFITLGTASYVFDTLSSGGMSQAIFTATLASEIETGTLIDLTVMLDSDPYGDMTVFLPKVGLVMEDFETGNFDSFGWEMGGTQPWITTTENVFDGTYSAVSGDISDLQTSELMLEMETAVDDSISFFRKVSCEDDPYNDNYDWLAFYIDGNEMDRWDGEVNWGRVAYPVTAGLHTFKWVFLKDYSVASGFDAAWIDNVIFPAPAPVINVREIQPSGHLQFTLNPNPAGEMTNIFLTLDSQMEITVNLYDQKGNFIRRLLDNVRIMDGSATITISTGDLANGIYYCTVEAGGQSFTRKLVINN